MNDEERFIELDSSYLEEMAELYRSAFSREPWNDDWGDTEQLREYIRDISGSYRALNYGLIINDRLAAICIGSIRHWWEGTNYIIEEFCVSPGLQGKGIGTRFLKMVEGDIVGRGIRGIFLQTDSDMPAYRFYKKSGFDELTSHVSFFKKAGE